MENKFSPLVMAKRFGKATAYSALATAVFWATNADAQLLNNLTIGNPKALALGNAVTADPPGIDSIHFNPAGLAKIKGRQREIKLLVADMNLETKFGSPTEPTDAVKQAYYNIRQDNTTDTACYQTNDINGCWGYDPVANTTTSSGDPVIMLPSAGITDVPVLAIPMGGIAFEDASNGWTFGTAVYVPQGVGFTRDPNSSGAYEGMTVGVTRLTYFSPTIAIQVTDNLSIGVGINFSYQGLGIETNIRAPMTTTKFLGDLQDLPQNIQDLLGGALKVIAPYDTVGTLSMEMQDYLSVGFNFGLLWEPNDWLAFGMSYQSETTSHLTGDYTMVNSDAFYATTTSLHTSGLDMLLPIIDGATFNAQKVESGTVKLDYITPQNISFGTSIRVLPSLKVNADLKWVNYSVWDTLDFRYSNKMDFLSFASSVNYLAGLDYADPKVMRISRYYDDVWSVAVGAEYAVNDNLVVRAGYEPRTSAIPHDRTDLLFPIGDADLYTVGFGMQLDSNTEISAALGYLVSTTNTAACESRNANDCIQGDVVYNPYYSIPFKNKTTAYLLNMAFDQKF